MPSPYTMICTSDFSGLVRGKGVPSAGFEKRCRTGIGWTPTNVQITCFDTIAESPYGALGDLVLRPDPATKVDAPLPDGRTLSFALGNISDLSGEPWECCTRSLLIGAIDRLKTATGLELRCTFEHEFMFVGKTATAAFSLSGFAERLGFMEALHEALAAAGIAPDSFLREYGPNQMEVTLPPIDPLRAADEAVILRELARTVAIALGERATFSPLLSPEIVGNGVHIHASLWREGRPVTHDPAARYGLSAEAGSFVAGILRHVNALVAITAPSVISYHRLTPHRWSAAYNNLGVQDREATVRICPISATDPDARARQYNFEYRAADATASPHLALAALIEAGLAGIEDRLPSPEATQDDISLWAPETLIAKGLARLPVSLGQAIEALEADRRLTQSWPQRMPAIYAAHKRGEIAHVGERTSREQFELYSRIY